MIEDLNLQYKLGWKAALYYLREYEKRIRSEFYEGKPGGIDFISGISYSVALLEDKLDSMDGN